MGGWNSRRLGALEAENPLNPRLVVLSAPADGVDEALDRYYAETPEERWAELVVVVARLTSSTTGHAG